MSDRPRQNERWCCRTTVTTIYTRRSVGPLPSFVTSSCRALDLKACIGRLVCIGPLQRPSTTTVYDDRRPPRWPGLDPLRERESRTSSSSRQWPIAVALSAIAIVQYVILLAPKKGQSTDRPSVWELAPWTRRALGQSVSQSVSRPGRKEGKTNRRGRRR